MTEKEIEECNAGLGTIEERVCFAYFPTFVSGKLLWFEKFIGVYEYVKEYYYWEEPVSEGIFYEKVKCHSGIRYYFKRIKKKLISK